MSGFGVREIDSVSLKEARREKWKKIKSERHELLEDRGEIIHKRKKQQQQDALRAAESITESLRRTRALLERELERSGKTLEKLAESNKMIANTLDEQHLYKDEVTGAKGVRKNMEKQEFTGMLFIGASFAIYVTVFLTILLLRYSFLVSWIEIPFVDII